MPTISVGRDLLFQALGRTYTQDEFDELCFEFGIELDDVTTEKAIKRKEKHIKEDEEITGDEEIIYKIEVPANRYDLLCLEGIAQSLRVFCGVDPIPNYTLAAVSKESMLKMHVKPETSMIRPYVVCAVLRGITFDKARYKSFIDLQDKLHQNICRGRTLVAIGTHDLDTIEGPFSYEALPPSDIEFKPLKQVKTFRADKLMEFYKSDLKLKKYLPIIEGSPVFPVIYDRNRTVLSLPPIINGAHSAISLKTKNVFIECTATDLTKAKIVLNTMVTMFSVYCERKFEVEPVEVIYYDGRSYVCPELSPYHMKVSLSYINSITNLSLEADKVTGLLNKMQLCAHQSVSEDNNSWFKRHVNNSWLKVAGLLNKMILYAQQSVSEDNNSWLKRHVNKSWLKVAGLLNKMQLYIEQSVSVDNEYIFTVSVPPTRSDVLHACDVAEDVAIAYGFDKIPERTLTSIKPSPLNQFSDLMRAEVAQAGYTEVLSMILYSYNENFPMLNRNDDRSTAVIIANPRSTDSEVPRSSLMAGILKTCAHSKNHPKPIKIFELGDVVVLDESKDVGATNRRQLAALYCGATSGFELIHGLVDRIMEVTCARFVQHGDNTGYYLERSDAPEFLSGRQASIIYKGKHIGTFGIVHPQVMENFGIPDPCSYVELNVESLL